MKRRALSLCLSCVCAFLAACADNLPAPIEDRNGPGISRADQRYVVLRGDTLFAIAFRYGLDFQRLAAANRIAAPYTIFPGQQLRLAESDPPRNVSVAPVVVPGSSPAARATTPRSTSKTEAPVTGSTSTVGAGDSASAPQIASAAGRTRAGSQTQARRPASTSSTKSDGKPNAPVSQWRWPATGTISRRFEQNLHKGVDIKGARGDAVLATASGSVVYAGSGIAGYGLMLIVRHNDEYLSAYGHNDELLVAEGEVVRAGQRIASRGSSGTDSIKLHFEIRRRGKPVDPLKLLPPR